MGGTSFQKQYAHNPRSMVEQSSTKMKSGMMDRHFKSGMDRQWLTMSEARKPNGLHEVD
jgi:hypothetical protein